MTDLPTYLRPLVPRLIDLLTEVGPMRLVAVTGPRQTGRRPWSSKPARS